MVMDELIIEIGIFYFSCTSC